MTWFSLFAAFPVVVLFASAGGADSAPQGPTGSAGLDRPFTLKAGTSVSLEAERLTVAFDRLLSDSRCPKGVNCIVAGEAVVRISLSKAGSAREGRDLQTTADGAEATYGAYRIKLVAVDPYPIADRQTAPKDYVVTLLVTRA